MANIKTLKKKVKVTESTFKITSAMKLVSAAKLNKSQISLENSSLYLKEIDTMLNSIMALNEKRDHPLLIDNNCKHSHILLVTSDRGLCGSYNAQLVEKVKSFIEKDKSSYKLHFLGKKGYELFKENQNNNFLIKKNHNEKLLTLAHRVSKKYVEQYSSGEIGAFYIAYNSYIGAGLFRPIVKKILPIKIGESKFQGFKEKYPFDFIYEPDAEEVLASVIHLTYETTFYNCLINATATEHVARMVAMDNAANNCKEAVKSLNIKINKMRQASITNELIEIVSGAESL